MSQAVVFSGNVSFQTFTVTSAGLWATVPNMANDNQATNGLTYNVPTGSTKGHQFQVNGVTAVSIIATASGAALNVGSNAQASTAGDIGIASSSTQGRALFGGSASNGGGSLDFGVGTAAQFTLKRNDGSCSLILGTQGVGNGSLNIPNGGAAPTILLTTSASTGGTSVAGAALAIKNANGTQIASWDGSGNYGTLGTQTGGSARELKRDIEDLSVDPIQLCTLVRWREFNYKLETLETVRRVGYVNDEAPEFFVGKNYDQGFTASTVASVAAAGVKEIAARLKAAGVSGF